MTPGPLRTLSRRYAFLSLGLLFSLTGLNPLRAQAPGNLSGSDQASLQRALGAYDDGDLKSAEPILRDLASRYPSNYEASEALGSLYVESDRVAQALPLLQRASGERPQVALAHANLGTAYFKTGNNAGALREFRDAASLDPQNAATQSALGQAFMAARQPAAAVKAFSVAAAITPDDAELRYNLALALYDSGAGRKAADLLKTLPHVYESEQIQSLAADAEEQAGNFQAALAHYQSAARLNPTDQNIYALAAELLRHWTWDEALKVARFGESRYPASTHFPLAAGIAFYGKAEYPGAVAIFSRLLAADPDNAAVADLLGRSCSLLADGENLGCNGIYDFAQRHPGNAVTDTYAAVAILHAPREKQDLDRAVVLLTTAIQADPGYAEAYYQMGVLDQARLQWKESAAALEKSIALRPGSPEAHYRLSRAYTHLDRRDDAQAQIALHQTYADQARNHLDAKMQEVVRFLLKPSS